MPHPLPGITPAERYAVGRYAAAALRRRPGSRGAPVTQLLFGEPVERRMRQGDYVRVRLGDGGREGWVAERQLLTVDAATFGKLIRDPARVLDLNGQLYGEASVLPVTFGAFLPEFDGLQLRHGGRRYRYSGQAARRSDLRQEPDVLLKIARRWLFVPELRGGCTPGGVDPVELIRLLCGLLGEATPPSVADMAGSGRSVDFVEQCQAGDLAYFGSGRGAVDHVGLLMPDSEVLHVHGCVRLDAIDHFGVFDREERRYTHRLRVVRRFLPDAGPAGALTIDPRVRPAAGDDRQIAIF